MKINKQDMEEFDNETMFDKETIKKIKRAFKKAEKIANIEKVIKTVEFRVQDEEDIFGNILFKEALEKVVKGKAVIKVYITSFNKVFNIVCNDGETIYVNRNKEKITRYEKSRRKDYRMTTNALGMLMFAICEGYEEEVI